MFKGLPLETKTAGQLWGADTIVERLDDAVFDDQGIAATRVRFRALSLVSVAPIRTGCGAFHVYLSLAGEQRVTTMRIFRTQEAGGDFVVPIAVDARMTFIPVKPARNARRLELTSSFTFPADPKPWSFTAGPTAKRIASVLVDTDGDLTPDAQLPGTSNFSPGQSPDRPWTNKGSCSCCPGEICHADQGKTHCTSQTMCPGMESCC